MLRTAPLEACAFGASLGNGSVFILDPRLMSILPYALRLSLRVSSQ